MNPAVGKIGSIVGKYKDEKGALVQILLDIQSEYGYLPKEALAEISKDLDIPLSNIYNVATFYKAFSLRPIGRTLIKVCLGTACYLRGSARVLEALERELGVKDGETTPDLEFTLQTVHCVGACALAPVMIVGERYFDKMTSTKVSSILRLVKSKNEKD